MKKIIFVILACILNLNANDLAKDKEVIVYSSPSCGCCTKWSNYMKSKNYNIKDIKTNDLVKIKDQYKIPTNLQSCHTAIIDGLVVEGHVPESAIKDLLNNKTNDVMAITAPGMPQGSPGMEQGWEENYELVLVMKNGEQKPYATYKGQNLIKKH